MLFSTANAAIFAEIIKCKGSAQFEEEKVKVTLRILADVAKISSPDTKRPTFIAALSQQIDDVHFMLATGPFLAKTKEDMGLPEKIDGSFAFDADDGEVNGGETIHRFWLKLAVASDDEVLITGKMQLEDFGDVLLTCKLNTEL